jgi:uncharacterized protein YabE (DUF348 family)
MASKLWREVLLALVVVASLVFGYMRTLTPLRLHIDGRVRNIGTHQTTVEAVLRDAAVKLHPLDRVEPPLDARLERDMNIFVTRARTVTIEADGRSWAIRTHESSAETLLAQQGIYLRPGDRLLVNGEEVRHSRSLGEEGSGIGGRYRGSPRLEEGAPPSSISVLRAVPLYVDDNGAQFTLETTSATIGEALRAAGISLYLGDHIEPALNRRVTAGLHVQIRRSLPIAIQVDGRVVRTRTFRASVGDVLGEIGISLVGLDYALPPPESALVPEMVVRVTRVWEEEITEQEPIPFRSTWQASPELEIDVTGIIQVGEPGVLQRRIRIRKEDGQEVARWLNEWVALDPLTHINGYGTQVVPHILDTPEGPLEYWRVIRMLATSYTKSTAGKGPDHPTYGITYTGLPMRHGLVAVDPRIVNLHTWVYVAGYGKGYAADTGGWIKNYRIDLGYDDSNFQSWYNWVDVYLLTPAPDPSRIRYVLPGSPAFGQ